jgi:hypothetical protein
MNQKQPSVFRAIAFYLPQFYPIPENDSFWGKGFTEWTNVTKAKSLFSSHYQPFLPSDLGFYDLRVEQVREHQAQLARDAGIEGFCYWHYWFGNGKRVLERVFNEVLANGRPDYPFCLAWANQDWTGKWHGLDHRYIFKQEYPDGPDIEEHFYALLPAFRDKRYIKVYNKPLFLIYKHDDLPVDYPLIPIWRKLAEREGLEGIYFVSNQGHFPSMVHNFDGYAENGVYEATQAAQSFFSSDIKYLRVFTRIINEATAYILDRTTFPKRLSYRRYSKNYAPNLTNGFYSTLLPGWDNTPRAGKKGLVFTSETPELFAIILRRSLEVLQRRPYQERLLFLKSWNEWAEGNVLEPSLKWGLAYTKLLHTLLLEASVR